MSRAADVEVQCAGMIDPWRWAATDRDHRPEVLPCRGSTGPWCRHQNLERSLSSPLATLSVATIGCPGRIWALVVLGTGPGHATGALQLACAIFSCAAPGGSRPQQWFSISAHSDLQRGAAKLQADRANGSPAAISPPGPLSPRRKLGGQRHGSSRSTKFGSALFSGTSPGRERSEKAVVHVVDGGFAAWLLGKRRLPGQANRGGRGPDHGNVRQRLMKLRAATGNSRLTCIARSRRTGDRLHSSEPQTVACRCGSQKPRRQ